MKLQIIRRLNIRTSPGKKYRIKKQLTNSNKRHLMCHIVKSLRNIFNRAFCK